MLQSVEAIVEPSGAVRLLESLRLDHSCRAVVTLLEPPFLRDIANRPSNSDDVLRFLEHTRLPHGARLRTEEIDAQVEEARNAWE